jgi:hypothetical protein
MRASRRISRAAARKTTLAARCREHETSRSFSPLLVMMIVPRITADADNEVRKRAHRSVLPLVRWQTRTLPSERVKAIDPPAITALVLPLRNFVTGASRAQDLRPAARQPGDRHTQTIAEVVDVGAIRCRSRRHVAQPGPASSPRCEERLPCFAWRWPASREAQCGEREQGRACHEAQPSV